MEETDSNFSGSSMPHNGTRRLNKKERAREAVAYALRKGMIKRPPVCECCGRQGRIEAHHWDYDCVFMITWLRSDCHRRIEMFKYRFKARKYRQIAEERWLASKKNPKIKKFLKR